MPVMGMMFLGLDPSSSGSPEPGDVPADEEAVAMIVTVSNSPDVWIQFEGVDRITAPAGSVLHLPFAKRFSWGGGEAGSLSVLWLKFAHNGELKRKLGY